VSEPLLHPGALTERVRRPITVLLAAFLVAGAFSRQPHNAAASLAGIVLALPCGYLGTRPGARLGAPLLWLAAAGVLLDAGGTASSVGYFGFCVLAVAAVPCAGPRAGALLIGVLAGVLIYKLFDDGVQTGWLPWLGGLTISSAGGALYARESAMLVALRNAQATLAQRSRAEERGRIARDLHDVIAHSLTVSLLHVTAARLAVEHDPDDAARALAEAERLGRESLEEVRSIVGMMRAGGDTGGDEPLLAPTPGLERIPDLIEGFRNAGVRISFVRGVDDGPVPNTVGTTAYRITQEALTNAVRHAPGGAVVVRLRAAEARLELTVDSCGAPGAGRGSGLGTMRERAEAVGGRLTASPVQVDGDPGWRVLAELPTRGGG
jgi:signal transduction histidine kinase